MTYFQLAILHLATVLPALFIGAVLLLRPKGTGLHRRLGRLYMLLMLTTAVVSLCMSAEVGPTLFGHFGFIHLFSVLVLFSVPSAYRAARAGHIGRHRRHMVGLYVGGILIAGSFALLPGRLLHGWILG